ncbi:MAG: hypothetical protein KTR25_20925 [Myxococcales bacterium]|nr:hypothetical protein [Myxococcales bacterium]
MTFVVPYRPRPIWSGVIFAVITLLGSYARAQDSDPLVAGFRHPPPAARPLAFWQWVNGNVTEEGIRHDFAWMKQVGMGGVFLMEIAFGSPPIPQYVAKRVGYGTTRWKNAIRVTAEEAARLGLSFGMQSSGGWSVSGGPDVHPAHAMKKVVWSTTIVRPRDQTVVLPPPPAINGRFQDYPASARDAKPTAAGNIAVLAYRLPPAEAIALQSEQRSKLSVQGVKDQDLLHNHSYAEATTAAPNDQGQVVITYAFSEPIAPRAFTVSVDNDVPVGHLEDEYGVIRAKLPGPAQHGAPARTYALSGAPSTNWRLVFEHQTAPLRVREARFDHGARVHRYQEKASFGTLANYESERSKEVPAGFAIDSETITDITHWVTSDGILSWRPPDGQWVVMWFGWSLTGRHVVPATPESRGFEVDKLSASAVQTFAETFYDRLLAAAGPRGQVDMAITDSWEAGALNWSPQLRTEFVRRRGYDPQPWFPVLAGRVIQSMDASERFLADWRRTIADLIADNHYGVLQKVLSARGMTYYGEAPGTNIPTTADGVQAKRRVEIPMGEFWYWPEGSEPLTENLADIREASSAASIRGIPIVAAESLTSRGEVPWSTGPREWRRMVDRFFTEGVTRVVMHTSTHQPFVDNLRPGMTLRQYGQHFTRNEAWAELANGWVSYISRCSFLLQQGTPVRDLAVFYGEDAAAAPPYDQSLRPPGYDIDFIDRETLAELAVHNGVITTPGGAHYRALQLQPGLARMSIETLTNLKALAKAGALVVGGPPRGPIELKANGKQFSSLVNTLWQPNGHGLVKVGSSIVNVLVAHGISPDVRVEGGPLHWTHRRIEGGEIYFLSNPKPTPFEGIVTLRASNAPRSAVTELWDATTGQKAALPTKTVFGGQRTKINIPGYSSIFVVRRKTLSQPAPPAPQPAGDIATLTGPWSITFIDDINAPKNITFDSLKSWTKHPHPAVRYYSGRAVYRTQLEMLDTPPAHVTLDLGQVGEMARVTINGHNLGVVWWSPARIDVDGHLHLGPNTIKIEVANYWRNRLIGDRQRGAIAHTFTPIAPYEANDILRPSGLIGPVRLVLME